MNRRKSRARIVDDSAVVRQTLSEVLSADPEIEGMGAVGDPYAAAERMREQVPNVTTLDIETRRSCGLTFPQKIMFQERIAVGVIMTGVSDDVARGMLERKEAGAAAIAQDEAISVVARGHA